MSDQREILCENCLVVIGGPTGVGKTALSLALAEELDAEIVSVDSLQVYRHLDIGTAKASEAERECVPHHLIDILNPDQECNVADFMKRAHDAIAEIHSRGKRVIAVGGTNLYIRVLVHGIFDAPPPDEELRKEHRKRADAEGSEVLHAELAEVDKVLSERVHPNDLVRISRGLEVYAQTGRPLSELQDEHRFKTPNYRALKLMLNRPREQLYARIDSRVDKMFELGIEDEYRFVVQELGYDYRLKPLQALGYRHLGQHFYEGLERDEMVRLFKRDTRRFAKQQVSWLRSERGVRWAKAPVVEDGRVPADVLADVLEFFEGKEPALEWTQDGSSFELQA